MAMHSRILTWRIPWTEEPGGLQSMESQRVGHPHTHTEVAKNSAKKPSYSECFWSPFHPRLPSGPRGKDVLFIFQ